MQKINRQNLLSELECVQFGIASREIIEQGSCFAFRRGQVFTWNDEIGCVGECSLEIEGAVKAAKVLEVLRKIADEDLSIEVKENEIVLSGKSKKIGITLENEILLPIDTLSNIPSKWKALPETFRSAIKMVCKAASKDASRFDLTCLHISPKYIEACDNYQMIRYHLEMPIKKNVLIKANTVEAMVNLDVTDFAENESFLFFRNARGVIFVCRKYLEDYPDISTLLDVKGTPLQFPKHLDRSIDSASVFSSDTIEDNEVKITLKPGKMLVEGRGDSGWYKEQKKVTYTGKPLAFMISPELLVEISKHYDQFEVTSDRLIVNGDSFRYVSCLGTVE